MLRGPIFLESRSDEGGIGCSKIAVAVLLPPSILNFIEGAALIEGKVENKKSRALLKRLKETAPCFLELCSTASTIFGVEKSKMRQILTDFQSVLEAVRMAGGKGGDEQVAQAFDMALRKLREGNPGSTKGQKVAGPPPSCYFDPSNKLTRSEYSMGAPFYDFETPPRIRHVIKWLGFVAGVRGRNFKLAVMNSDEWLGIKWFEATMADALFRLHHESNQGDVWKALESMGIKLTCWMRDAVIKQFEGFSADFNKRKRGKTHWTFDQKAFDDAKKRWADKWADHFAEELNNSAQGIVKYGKNEFYDLRESTNSVRSWICQNTKYGLCRPDMKNHGQHEMFMDALEKYCRKKWYDDIVWAVNRHRQRARGVQEESSRFSSLLSSILCTKNLQLSEEVLQSDLKNLGLTLPEPAIKIIGTLAEDNLGALHSIRQAFQIDPALVVQHAAKQIKAYFSTPKRSEINTSVSTPEHSEIEAAFSLPGRSEINTAFSPPGRSENRKRPHE